MATDGYVSHQQQKWETYLAEHQIEKIFRDMTSDIITKQPQDSIQHMIEWLHKFREAKTKPKKSDKKGKKKKGRQRVVESSDSDSDGSSEDDRPFVAVKQSKTRRGTIAAPRLSLTKNWTPPSVPKEAHEESFLGRQLMTIFFMKSCTRKELHVLVGAMSSQTYEDGATIIKQGERGDAFYVVEDGEVVCMKDDEKVMSIPCPSTEDPSVERRYFGELALLYDAPRAASVKAVGRTKLWALDRTTFKSILQQSDDIKMMLYSKFVQSIHLFRDLKLSQVNALCASLQAQDFDDGDTIFKQGDDGDAFYIVESGEAACLKDGVVVSIVHEGDYFGELALVRNEPRQATVRAEGKLSVLKIGSRQFKRLIGVLEFDKVY